MDGGAGVKGPVVLMILDGWGLAPQSHHNAITQAPDRHYQDLRRRYLSTEVKAHGSSVGLMDDQMGDSNVGHLTLGAGRVIPQYLTRIFDAVANQELSENPVLARALEKAQGHRLHIMGLLSPGGVHSHQEHLRALMDVARDRGQTDVVYHLWLDGRDVAPTSAMASLEWMAGALNETGLGRIASVSGRYYAMDRDRRWDRTEKAYRAMVEGVGYTALSAMEALDAAYHRGETDEFVTPTVLVDSKGHPIGRMAADDVVLVFNFRADRVRQITRAMAHPHFEEFHRPYPRLAVFGMTEYDENFVLPHLFERIPVVNHLAQWLSDKGVAQLHVAETEKYAHVTFFFNGGQERVYNGEDRVLIDSPKVATYDQAPAMSAGKIADAVLKGLKEDRYGFILLNFANADMVGHTGKLESAIEAVGVVDEQIGRIAQAVLDEDGALVIVSDHGNAEVMQDEYGKSHTNHTTNPVPLAIIAGPSFIAGTRLMAGELSDVAPTVLDLMDIDVPSEITGQSLLRRERDSDE